MKRKLTIILSTALITIVLFLTGCSKPTLVGKWKGEIDMTDFMQTQFGSGEDTVFEIDEFKVPVEFKFEEKVYKMTIDEEGFKDAMLSLKPAIINGIKKELEETASSMDITVDELLNMTGTTIDTMVDEMLNDDSLNAMITESELELETSYRYKVEEGKLYSSEAGENEINEEEYIIYELTKNTLKFTELVGANKEDTEMLSMLCPIELTKTK